MLVNKSENILPRQVVCSGTVVACIHSHATKGDSPRKCVFVDTGDIFKTRLLHEDPHNYARQLRDR
mgnify:CR=1 FL=1